MCSKPLRPEVLCETYHIDERGGNYAGLSGCEEVAGLNAIPTGRITQRRRLTHGRSTMLWFPTYHNLSV